MIKLNAKIPMFNLNSTNDKSHSLKNSFGKYAII